MILAISASFYSKAPEKVVLFSLARCLARHRGTHRSGGLATTMMMMTTTTKSRHNSRRIISRHTPPEAPTRTRKNGRPTGKGARGGKSHTKERDERKKSQKKERARGRHRLTAVGSVFSAWDTAQRVSLFLEGIPCLDSLLRSVIAIFDRLNILSAVSISSQNSIGLKLLFQPQPPASSKELTLVIFIFQAVVST